MVWMREAMAMAMEPHFSHLARIWQGMNRLQEVPQIPELLPVTKG